MTSTTDTLTATDRANLATLIKRGATMARRYQATGHAVAVDEYAARYAAERYYGLASASRYLPLVRDLAADVLA